MTEYIGIGLGQAQQDVCCCCCPVARSTPTAGPVGGVNGRRNLPLDNVTYRWARSWLVPVYVFMAPPTQYEHILR